MDDMPELYLTTEDVLAWLGITRYRLDALAWELDIRVCDRRLCRYTAPHLRRIKALNDRALEIGISVAAAGKVQRAIERQKAARQHGEAARRGSMSRTLTSGQAVTSDTEARARQRAIAEGIEVRHLDASGLWIATSGRDPHKAYVLTIVAGVVKNCGCKAGEFGGYCKHRAAWEMAQEDKEEGNG